MLNATVKPGTFARSYSRQCFHATRDVVLPPPVFIDVLQRSAEALTANLTGGDGSGTAVARSLRHQGILGGADEHQALLDRSG